MRQQARRSTTGHYNHRITETRKIQGQTQADLSLAEALSLVTTSSVVQIFGMFAFDTNEILTTISFIEDQFI
jgi:hypothetical protein